MADIEKKKDINQYTRDMMRGKGNSEFKGNFVNHNFEREEKENMDSTNQPIEEESPQNYQTTKTTTFKNQNNPKHRLHFETERERRIRIFKLNSARILHERNKYVFLASVAERAISLGLKLSDVLGFILIKKLFKMLCYLRYRLQNKVF